MALKVPAPDEKPKIHIQEETTPTRNPFSWLTCTILGIIAAALIVILIVAFWLYNRPGDSLTPTNLPETSPIVTFTITVQEVIPSETPIPSPTLIPETLTPWPTNPPSSTEEGF